jgi:CRP/FNR family transcriptional regulator, cyclic AMP receptor protein
MPSDKSPFARFLTHYKPGDVLFREGDGGEEMYIIQSGKVAIKKKVKDGSEAVLATLEKGDFFGEMSILERLPRAATAEVVEEGDLIVIGGETFGDMIKSNPEIAVRMLRKYSIRLRETNKQLEQVLAKGGAIAPQEHREVPAPEHRDVPAPKHHEVQPPEHREVPQQERRDAPPPAPAASAAQPEAVAFFVSRTTGNVFPVAKAEALIGRFDSVTGTHPDVDLSDEDQSRNISRRHARLVTKDGRFFVAEEIGTMNGTFLNGKKLTNGVLTPINDGDELVLCRLPLTFKVAAR